MNKCIDLNKILYHLFVPYILSQNGYKDNKKGDK